MQGEEPPAQLALKLSALLPIGVGRGGRVLPVPERAYGPDRYRIALRQFSQCLVKVVGERQQVIALVGETLAYRLDTWFGVFELGECVKDKVIQRLARGGIGTGKGEQVFLEPLGQGAHLVGDFNCLRLPLPRMGERAGKALALALVLGLVHLAFEPVTGVDSGLGAVIQRLTQLPQFLEGVKHITMAG